MDGPVRPHPEGALVRVRAQPGASRAAVVGLHGDELRVRVCSPPQDGRANEELCALVAAAIGVRDRDVWVVSGHASRSKALVVAADLAVVAAALAPWIGPDTAPGR